MRRVAICLMMFLFLMVGVSAAMDPVPAYCEHQGYDVVSIFSGEYRGYDLEKLRYYPSGKSYLGFNGPLFELDASKREMLEINRIVLGTTSTYGEINWSDREYYCEFDEDNKCDMDEFYNGVCGVEYKKDTTCRKDGEIFFSQFEECCEGYESSYGWWNSRIMGQPSCVEKLNFFQKFWRWVF